MKFREKGTFIILVIIWTMVLPSRCLTNIDVANKQRNLRHVPFHKQHSIRSTAGNTDLPMQLQLLETNNKFCPNEAVKNELSKSSYPVNNENFQKRIPITKCVYNDLKFPNFATNTEMKSPTLYNLGDFPEVEYPLTASDAWIPKYWNSDIKSSTNRLKPSLNLQSHPHKKRKSNTNFLQKCLEDIKRSHKKCELENKRNKNSEHNATRRNLNNSEEKEDTLNSVILNNETLFTNNPKSLQPLSNQTSIKPKHIPTIILLSNLFSPYLKTNNMENCAEDITTNKGDSNYNRDCRTAQKELVFNEYEKNLKTLQNTTLLTNNLTSENKKELGFVSQLSAIKNNVDKDSKTNSSLLTLRENLGNNSTENLENNAIRSCCAKVNETKNDVLNDVATNMLNASKNNIALKNNAKTILNFETEVTNLGELGCVQNKKNMPKKLDNHTKGNETEDIVNYRNRDVCVNTCNDNKNATENPKHNKLGFQNLIQIKIELVPSNSKQGQKTKLDYKNITDVQTRKADNNETEDIEYLVRKNETCIHKYKDFNKKSKVRSVFSKKPLKCYANNTNDRDTIYDKTTENKTFFHELENINNNKHLMLPYLIKNNQRFEDSFAESENKNYVNDYKRIHPVEFNKLISIFDDLQNQNTIERQKVKNDTATITDTTIVKKHNKKNLECYDDCELLWKNLEKNKDVEKYSLASTTNNIITDSLNVKLCEKNEQVTSEKIVRDTTKLLDMGEQTLTNNETDTLNTNDSSWRKNLKDNDNYRENSEEEVGLLKSKYLYSDLFKNELNLINTSKSLDVRSIENEEIIKSQQSGSDLSRNSTGIKNNNMFCNLSFDNKHSNSIDDKKDDIETNIKVKETKCAKNTSEVKLHLSCFSNLTNDLEKCSDGNIKIQTSAYSDNVGLDDKNICDSNMSLPEQKNKIKHNKLALEGGKIMENGSEITNTVNQNESEIFYFSDELNSISNLSKLQEKNSKQNIEPPFISLLDNNNTIKNIELDSRKQEERLITEKSLDLDKKNSMKVLKRDSERPFEPVLEYKNTTKKEELDSGQKRKKTNGRDMNNNSSEAKIEVDLPLHQIHLNCSSSNGNIATQKNDCSQYNQLYAPFLENNNTRINKDLNLEKNYTYHEHVFNTNIIKYGFNKSKPIKCYSDPFFDISSNITFNYLDKSLPTVHIVD